MKAMKTSVNGINLIKKFEGCKLKAYRCPAGVPTIGYGHTKGVKMGQVITQEQADQYLREDLEKYEKNVMKYYNKYKWNQNEFDALVSFAYNLGSIDQLTANGTRSKNVIADKMILYNKAAGKVLNGLVKRRKAERNLFLKDNNLEQIAREVIDGKWGNGEARKQKLSAAGYDPKAVQAEVNRILAGGGSSALKPITTVAKEVINGKWGNGEARKKKLAAAGYDPAVVQAEVNRLLR